MKIAKSSIYLVLFSFLLSMVAVELLAKAVVEFYYKPTFPAAELRHFYQKHAATTNHLRRPDFFERLGVDIQADQYEQFIYSQLSEGPEAVLIQGDSWGEQFVTSSQTSEKFSNLDNEFSVYIAGTSSYSPSLMSAQLNLLRNEFDLSPALIVSIVDQTDIGDELCRYRRKREVDQAGNVLVRPYSLEAGDHYNETYNSSFVWEYMDILYSDDFSVLKLINKAKKKREYESDKKKSKRLCSWNTVASPLFGKHSKEDYEYFVSTFSEYVNRVFADKGVKRLMVLTHFHRKHAEGEYKLNVADLLRDALLDSSHAAKVDLVDIRPEDYGEAYSPEIFMEDDVASHLTHLEHSRMYSDRIIAWMRRYRKKH